MSAPLLLKITERKLFAKRRFLNRVGSTAMLDKRFATRGALPKRGDASAQTIPEKASSYLITRLSRKKCPHGRNISLFFFLGKNPYAVTSSFVPRAIFMSSAENFPQNPPFRMIFRFSPLPFSRLLQSRLPVLKRIFSSTQRKDGAYFLQDLRKTVVIVALS